jgi:phage FluMu protein Com
VDTKIIRGQTIHCGNCGELIVRVSGDGWIENGWVPCPHCLMDTRILNARESGECRPTELLNQGQSTRKAGSVASA